MFKKIFISLFCIISILFSQIVPSYLLDDIDTKELQNYLGARSPYPGGVGPITVSALYSNLAKLIN